MTFTPRRGLGLLLGFLFLALLAGTVILSVIQLGRAMVSAWIILWVALPLACVPLASLIAYRLYGLLTSHYWLDRDGFRLTWGLATERIPLEAIGRPRRGTDFGLGLRPVRSLWWPGCVVGQRKVEGIGLVEFFATSFGPNLIVLSAGDRHLAISPPDPDGFLQSFRDAVRLGSLERIPERSQRPDFLFSRLWADRLARGLILAGLALPLLLLAYLAIRAPGMPSGAPFGFDPNGNPGPLAPPGRLLLLPFIGGLGWLADLALGAWLFRREADQRLGYVLWATAVLLGALLWGAALQLLAAAPVAAQP
jgi:hypothetical protein